MPDEYPIQGKPSRLNVQCKWLVFISYNWQKVKQGSILLLQRAQGSIAQNWKYKHKFAIDSNLSECF